ncbi:MAG: GNAT family N-acetyltransferase [Rhodocyclaceae bacterium]|nr:GNAT family N-acetyltransferase [Rhodocyclaceae bacterium]
MPWEIKPAQSTLAAFATEWDRLNHTFYGNHPLFDSRFVIPLLEYFGDGSEQLCVHRTASVVDGALILYPRGPGRWALFLPSQAQAGPVLLADARLLETLMPALPGYVWSIELFALDPQFSPDWRHLRLPRTIQPHALTITTTADGDFDAYWNARPRHLIQNLRRYQRRAAEQFGAAAFVMIDAPQEIAAAVARYGTLESAGWKGKAGTAVNIDNVQGSFYEKVLGDFARSGQARVLELHIGGKLAASRLIIRDARLWIMLKTSYDESLAAVAPGRQLLHETLKRAFSDLQSGSVEFYTNASVDQAQWATSLRYIRHHQLYRSQPLAAAHLLVKLLRAAIAGRRDGEAAGTTPKFSPLLIKQYASPQEFTPDTARFFEEFSRKNIEFSIDWFANLQHGVFAEDPGIRYYVAELAGQPVAAMPIRLIREGVIRRIEALGNFYTSLYSPAFSPTATALDLLPILEAENCDCRGAHVMRFAPMDSSSPTYEALLTALRTTGWVPFRYFCFGNWFLKIDKPWSEYLKAREGKLRNTLKRTSKKFAAEGGTLEIISEPEDIEPAIRAFNAVYAVSWKKPEPYPEFIPGLIRSLAARGSLRLGIARLAGQPIAAQLWTVYQGRAHIFKLAYDAAFAHFSSGTLLTAHLMEHVIDRDEVAEVDYLIGDDAYKQLWMSHRRERWGIVAYNPRTLIGLALLVREVAGRLFRKLVKK